MFGHVEVKINDEVKAQMAPDKKSLVSQGHGTQLKTTLPSKIKMIHQDSTTSVEVAREIFSPTEVTRFVEMDKKINAAEISLVVDISKATNSKYFLRAKTAKSKRTLSQKLGMDEKHFLTVANNNVQFVELAEVINTDSSLPVAMARIALNEQKDEEKFNAVAKEISDHQIERLPALNQLSSDPKRSTGKKETRLTQEQIADKRQNRYGAHLKTRDFFELQYKVADKTKCTITLTPETGNREGNEMVYLSNFMPDADTIKNPELLKNILVDALSYVRITFPGVKVVTLMAPGKEFALAECLDAAYTAYSSKTGKPLFQSLDKDKQEQLGIFPMFVGSNKVNLLTALNRKFIERNNKMMLLGATGAIATAVTVMKIISNQRRVV